VVSVGPSSNVSANAGLSNCAVHMVCGPEKTHGPQSTGHVPQSSSPPHVVSPHMELEPDPPDCDFVTRRLEVPLESAATVPGLSPVLTLLRFTAAQSSGQLVASSAGDEHTPSPHSAHVTSAKYAYGAHPIGGCGSAPWSEAEAEASSPVTVGDLRPVALSCGKKHVVPVGVDAAWYAMEPWARMHVFEHVSGGWDRGGFQPHVRT
jgi:hypothetical protein